MNFVEFMRSVAGRILRIALGLVILWFALTQMAAPWSWVVALIGLVPIAAGVFNFCVLGPLLGVDFWGRKKTAV